MLNVTKLRVNPDDVLDQGAGLNHNADWVNLKGAVGWYGETIGRAS